LALPALMVIMLPTRSGAELAKARKVTPATFCDNLRVCTIVSIWGTKNSSALVPSQMKMHPTKAI